MNQPFTGNDPAYYSVQSDVFQIISQARLGTRNYQFLRWSGTDVQLTADYDFCYQSGVVFNSDNAVVNAELKGHLLSDDQQTLSIGSQRRLVRTVNGIYHICYESMGWIWYTYSLTTDFNGAWSDEQAIWGKNPSLDYEGNNLLIIVEGDDGGQNEAAIHLITIIPDANGVYTYNENTQLVTTYPIAYYGYAFPVVASNGNEQFFVYRKSSSTGLYYRRFWYVGGVWHYDNESTIPNTSLTSVNPSIAIAKQGVYNEHVHIVYQEGNLNPSIKYIRWNGLPFHSDYTISNVSTFNSNYFPSISLFKKTAYTYEPIVSWIGRNIGTLGKTNGTSTPDPRVVVRPASDSYNQRWGSISVFGELANSAQNNSVLNTFDQSVITWGQNDGSEAKWVKRNGTSFYGPYCLLPAGFNTGVSNGTSLSEIKAATLDCSEPPYIINQSPETFLAIPDCGGIEKVVTTYPYTFSRAGVILLKGIEFAYHTGDVVINDSAMQFISVPDTIIYNSASELNQILRTNDFQLNPNSSLVFSNYYYVLNKEMADSLSDDESVSFRVELVNSVTGDILGTFDNITYNRNNLDDYENESYLVNCSGIPEGNYYFRLVTSVSGNAYYNLINAVNDASYLAKRSFKDISFTGEKFPVAYNLSQNYPNPFNPTTTINYQLPKSGFVTLKVYDILGKEVTTLVNEQKTQGRYSTNFDASKLSSGVYIYQIRANDYVSSRKMLLVK